MFRGGEYATNLIIGNVKTLSHDDSYPHSFSSDGHQFGGRGPLAFSGFATAPLIQSERWFLRKFGQNHPREGASNSMG